MFTVTTQMYIIKNNRIIRKTRNKMDKNNKWEYAWWDIFRDDKKDIVQKEFNRLV